MRISLLVALAVTMLGCSSSSGDDDDDDSGSSTSEPAANPCATPGATYLETFSTISGNCGDVPSQIVNVSNDGTIPAATGTNCQKVEQDGCRGHNTGCKVTQNGCTTTVTTDVTFADDGASASGIFTASIQCGDGSNCTGTYEVTMTRR